MPLFAAVILFFFAAMVWPIVRLWRSTGKFAIVGHTDPTQRLMGLFVAVWLFGLLGWSLAWARLGAAPLSVWNLPSGVATAGFSLLALGLAVTVIAQAQMGASWRIGIDEESTALVTRGLFSVIRNPIYSAMLLAFAGLVLITPSPWTVMGWLAVAQVLFIQTRFEEQHLLFEHGSAYRAYAQRVGRFLPGVGRLY